MFGGRFIYLAALFIQSSRFLFIPNHNFLLLHGSQAKCVFRDWMGISKKGDRIPKKYLERKDRFGGKIHNCYFFLSVHSQSVTQEDNQNPLAHFPIWNCLSNGNIDFVKHETKKESGGGRNALLLVLCYFLVNFFCCAIFQWKSPLNMLAFPFCFFAVSSSSPRQLDFLSFL